MGKITLSFGFLILLACASPYKGDSFDVNSGNLDIEQTDHFGESTKYFKEWFETKWCVPYAKKICDSAKECGCHQIPDFPKESCENLAREFCVIKTKKIWELLVTGDLVLQSDAIDSCFQILDKALSNCLLPNPFEFSVSCPIVVAPVDISEKCKDGLCAKGTGYCAPPGICKPLAGEGKECMGSLCQNGLRCDEGLCIKPRPLGEVCSRDNQCETGLICINGVCSNPVYPKYFGNCISPPECGLHMYCVATMKRICSEPPKMGESCLESCDKYSYCYGGLCRKSPEKGEPCGEDGISCMPGLACDMFSSTCKPLPSKGESCALGQFGPVICKDGLVCRGGVCEEPPGLGETCAQGRDGFPICKEGLGCLFTRDGRSICSEKVGFGNQCTNNSECMKGLYCDFESLVCKEKVPKGSQCTDDYQCMEGLSCFSSQVGLDKTCQEIPKLNETCLTRCQDDLLCVPVATKGMCAPEVCTALPF